jgi:hypothetical protein
MQSFDRAFLMMAGRAAQKIYGAKATPLLNYYFTPLGISQLPLAEKDCTTPYLAWLNANPSTLFHLSPRPPMTAEQQALRDLISVGTRAASSPIILMMGTNDTIVPPSLIPAWVDEACSHGQQVEVRWFPTGHFPIPTTDIASWINDRFTGVPAGSSCP